MDATSPADAATTTVTRPLAGKAALVTGSTSGIGLGIARALARDGAAIVLNGFGTAEDIAEARSTIERDFGVPATYSAADVADPAAISRMVETTLAAHGRLDILVNNAGIQHVAPVTANAAVPEFRFFTLLFVTLGEGRVDHVRRERHGLPSELAAYDRFTTFERAVSDFLGPIWKTRSLSDHTSYPLVR
jgi:NAD(P)-dependent dehydrogenase (short-subunit alcohol dehydrogenase family)